MIDFSMQPYRKPSPEQRRVLYLLLKRRATLDGSLRREDLTTHRMIGDYFLYNKILVFRVATSRTVAQMQIHGWLSTSGPKKWTVSALGKYVFEATMGRRPKPTTWGYCSEKAKRKLGKHWVSRGARNQRKHIQKMAQKIADGLSKGASAGAK